MSGSTCEQSDCALAQRLMALGLAEGRSAMGAPESQL